MYTLGMRPHLRIHTHTRVAVWAQVWISCGGLAFAVMATCACLLRVCMCLLSLAQLHMPVERGGMCTTPRSGSPADSACVCLVAGLVCMAAKPFALGLYSRALASLGKHGGLTNPPQVLWALSRGSALNHHVAIHRLCGQAL